MTPEEVRDIAKAAAHEAAREVMETLGADVSNPREMQQDFARLREWRTSMDKVQQKALLATVGLVVSGLIAAVWIGLRQYIGGGK